MKIKTIGIAAAASLLAIASPALAQVAAGTKVQDAQGGEVGTVVSAADGFVTVKTDKHEARLPENSFTKDGGKLLFGMTRDQLNAEIDKSMAAAQANLAPGAKVTGTGGAQVGTLDAIDDQFATLKLSSGKVVKIPRAGIAAGPDGAVIGLSAAELEAQVGGEPAPEAAQ